MHERTACMFDLSDAFVALPGGFGTLDEMFEMLTWRQLGLGSKPCAFLDVADFYDPLLAMIDRMVAERFLQPDQRSCRCDRQLVGWGNRAAVRIDTGVRRIFQKKNNNQS